MQSPGRVCCFGRVRSNDAESEETSLRHREIVAINKPCYFMKYVPLAQSDWNALVAFDAAWP